MRRKIIHEHQISVIEKINYMEGDFDLHKTKVSLILISSPNKRKYCQSFSLRRLLLFNWFQLNVYTFKFHSFIILFRLSLTLLFNVLYDKRTGNQRYQRRSTNQVDVIRNSE